MHRVRLIHWKRVEAEEKINKLRAAGYDVEYDDPDMTVLRKMRNNPPDAVIVDLSRLPSQGRDIGLAIRNYKSTRHVPLVFVDGIPEKVARTRKLLPDAQFTTWPRIRGCLKRAIAHPPTDPVVPHSVMAGYSDTPLVKKLGIKENSVVTLVGAPQGFEETLGRLPDGVRFRRRSRGPGDLTIWFTRSRKDLERLVERMVDRAEGGGLWIVWPKKTSPIASDLTQKDVRRIGLSAGLVDFKVCAVDETWSGLRFTVRKSNLI
jgi:hypothetical protein